MSEPLTFHDVITAIRRKMRDRGFEDREIDENLTLLVLGFETTQRFADERKAEIERLRQHLDRTADGELVVDCGTLYCPRCNGPMAFSNVGCFCDNHCFPEGADETVCLSKPRLR